MHPHSITSFINRTDIAGISGDICRRSFLKMGGGVCISTMLSPISLFAQSSPDRVISKIHSDIFGEAEWDTAKNTYMDAEETAEAVSAVTAKTEATSTYYPGLLPIRVPNTGEAYTLPFRHGTKYDPNTFKWINWLLRCHGDKDATVTMDYRLIEQLNYISHYFGHKVITLHSGYRTPAYNRRLGENNRKVAPNSFHMAGRAIDFSIPGVKLRDICSVALYYRNYVGYGGVGFYPKDGFMHIDTGPTRQWIS